MMLHYKGWRGSCPRTPGKNICKSGNLGHFNDMSDRTSRPLEPRFNEQGFSILESHHTHYFVMKESVASYGKLLVPFDGEGVLQVGALTPVSLTAGRVAWVGPEIRHYLEDNERRPLKLFIACFANRAIQAHAIELGKPAPQIVDHPDWLEESWNRFREWRLAASRDLQLHEVLGRSLGYWLLSRLILEGELQQRGRNRFGSSGRDSRERVQQALDELAHSFYLNETLDQVSHRWGLSRRRFTSLVQEISGRSWHNLRMRYRIQHACHLLRSAPRPLATIAFECGYSEFSTFYRNFKNVTGTSPMQFSSSPPQR